MAAAAGVKPKKARIKGRLLYRLSSSSKAHAAPQVHANGTAGTLAILPTTIWKPTYLDKFHEEQLTPPQPDSCLTPGIPGDRLKDGDELIQQRLARLTGHVYEFARVVTWQES